MVTFNTAKNILPVFKSSKVSKLKVENVLNPPQNPIIISGFIMYETSPLKE